MNIPITHIKQPKHREFCDCGDKATLRRGGEWICATCASLEHDIESFHRGMTDRPAWERNLRRERIYQEPYAFHCAA